MVLIKIISLIAVLYLRSKIGDITSPYYVIVLNIKSTMVLKK